MHIIPFSRVFRYLENTADVLSHGLFCYSDLCALLELLPHDADFVLAPPGSRFSLFCFSCRLLFVIVIFNFSCFSSPDVQAAAAESFGTHCCKKLSFTAFNRSADNTVITYCRSFS